MAPDDEKKPLNPASAAGGAPDELPATKIRITEDAEATGDVAEAYDFWRKGSGRTKVPGIIKCFGARPDFLRQCDSVFEHSALLRGSSNAPPQGDDRQPRFFPESMPVLTGFPCLLPACSGSHRSMCCSDSGRQARRSRAYAGGARVAGLRPESDGVRFPHHAC